MVPGPPSDDERARAVTDELFEQRRAQVRQQNREMLRRRGLVAATMVLVALVLWWLQR